MPLLTVPQVYALARGTGLSHEQAITATAIQWAENDTHDTGAMGDLSLQDAKWGPSVGLWQIRSLKAQQGTGGTRDASRLTDPAFNARSMFAESNGGRNWSPWSTYKDDAYVDHVAAVRKAVGDGTAGPAGSVQDVSDTGADGVTVATGKSPFDIDLHLGPLSGPLEGLIGAAGPLALAGLLLLGGVGLVVVGMYQAAKS